MSDLGPILRSLTRHKGPSVMLASEVAVGMAVLVHLIAMGSHYDTVAFAGSGLDEPNLIFVTRRFSERAEPEGRARARALADRALLASVPGVAAVVVVDELPLQRKESFATVLRTSTPDGTSRAAVAWPLRASEDVVAALGLRRVAGAELTAADADPPDTRRALVTEELARQLFPAGGAVGGFITGEGFPRARVAGVLADFRVRMPFLPDSNSVVILIDLPVSAHGLSYVVRSAPGRREAVAAGIAKAFGLAPASPAGDAGDDTIQMPRSDHGSPRFQIIARGARLVIAWTSAVVLCVTLFGSLALASFSVAERTRQIGVRRALGARRGQIVRYFLLENAIVTGVGLIVGLALALALNVPVRDLMPSMAVTWRQLAAAMAVMWAAGLLSALVPALRAARIPPSAATRSL